MLEIKYHLRLYAGKCSLLESLNSLCPSIPILSDGLCTIGADLAMSKPSWENLNILRVLDTLQSSLSLLRLTRLEAGLRGRGSARGGGESGGFSYLGKYPVMRSDERMLCLPIDTGTSPPVIGVKGSIDGEEWLLVSE